MYNLNLKTFYKCQSLGNDFVLLDWLDEDQANSVKYLQSKDWSEFVRNICARNFGVGADGVLIVKKNTNGQVVGLVFNADGSYGETSLNGLRCIANYLIKQKLYPNDFMIVMGNKEMHCSYQDNAIKIEINNFIYQNTQNLDIVGARFSGHVINVGNPHFVIFSKIEPKWLADNGVAISEHKYFSNRTNVEFVWENPTNGAEQKSYTMLVYERGCGMTLSCGSGAAAVAAVLHKLNKVKADEIFSIVMSGGKLKTCISNQSIVQCAPAEIVFAARTGFPPARE